MNKTIVTTLPREKTGDLQFPFLSKAGIVPSKDLATYIDALIDAGHNFTTGQLEAFIDFVNALIDAGVYNNIIECYPIFGNNLTAARTPIMNKLCDNAMLEIPDGNPNTEINSGNIYGIRDGFQIFSPITLNQLRVKSSAFENENLPQH